MARPAAHLWAVPDEGANGHPGPDASRPTLVIVPALDEEVALPVVLADLAAVEPAVDVVVIDDGSVDDTADIARRHGAAVVSLPFNLGIGGALRTGFRYAVRRGYDRAVQVDGDGQHDPAQIGALLEALDAGADLVIGSRFAARPTTSIVGHAAPGEHYDGGRVRARAMGVLRFAVRQLSGRRFTDTSSGFRAFSRPMLDYFAGTYPDEYMESVEALVLACANGFTVEEVPVEMRPRQGGRPSARRPELFVHYLRVLLVLAAGGPRTRRRRP